MCALSSHQSRYNKGNPFMKDDDYEALRKKLIKQGSDAVKHEASSCKILDDGKKECKADLFPEDGKNSILYAPAFFQMGLLFMEWAYWVHGWDPILGLILTSPGVAVTTWLLTNKVYFQDPYIVRYACLCAHVNPPLGALQINTRASSTFTSEPTRTTTTLVQL